MYGSQKKNENNAGTKAEQKNRIARFAKSVSPVGTIPSIKIQGGIRSSKARGV